MKIRIAILEGDSWNSTLINQELGEMMDQVELSRHEDVLNLSKCADRFAPQIVLVDFESIKKAGYKPLLYLKDKHPDCSVFVLVEHWSEEVNAFLSRYEADEVISMTNLARLTFAVQRVVSNINNRKELKENFEVQEALADISAALNTPEGLEVRIENVLAIMGEVSEVSRVYIFEDFDNGRRCKNTYEWCAEGVNPQIEYLQDLSYEEDVPGWKEYMHKNGQIQSNDIRQLPKAFQTILEPQQIKAILVYPIHISCTDGFVGLDETRGPREWSESLKRMLKTAAGLISHAIKEKQVTEQLIRKNIELGTSLAEQQVLLSEVHHRVKNNLALISSFLELEKFNPTDSDPNEVLDTNLLRIKSIAIVQELIYESGSLINVDIAKTLRKLLTVIYNIEWNAQPDILMDKNQENIFLNVNQAIPFTLLISEMYHRSFHYQEEEFTYHIPDQIFIGINLEDDNLTVQIRDESLHDIFKKIPTVHDFSEIAEVLSQQLSAEVKTITDSDIIQIQFNRLDKKGSFSAIG